MDVWTTGGPAGKLETGELTWAAAWAQTVALDYTKYFGAYVNSVHPWGDNYILHRGFIAFDTSVIPTASVLNSAVLRFTSGYKVLDKTDSMSFTLLSSEPLDNPLYPGISPLAMTDFNRVLYTETVVGHDFTGLVWDGTQYVLDVVVSADAFVFSTYPELAYILKGVGAVTKFCLMCDYDTNNVAPGSVGANRVYGMQAYGAVEDAAIKLVVDYTEVSEQVVRTDQVSGVNLG
jgi:hypothetical protein